MSQKQLESLATQIEKNDTFYRKTINSEARLITGKIYGSVMIGFHVAHNSMSKFVKECCEEVVAQCADKVMTCPRTPNQQKQVAAQFSVTGITIKPQGVIEQKHVRI